MKNDVYLLRWLTATDFDLDHAIEKFKTYMSRRKEKSVDIVVSEDFTFFDDLYPFIIEGVDMDSRPLLFAPLGTMDFRKITLAGQDRMIKRYAMRQFELMEEYTNHLRESTKPYNQSQFTFILDISGFNLKQTACLKCLTILPDILSDLEQHYPNIIYRWYFINVPSIFDIVIRIFQNFMSQRTLHAMRFFDYDKTKWSAALLEQIPADQLPSQYGGTREVKMHRSSLLHNPTQRNLIETWGARERMSSKSFLRDEAGEDEIKPVHQQHTHDEKEKAHADETSSLPPSTPEPKSLSHHSIHHHHHVSQPPNDATDSALGHDHDHFLPRHQLHQQDEPSAFERQSKVIAIALTGSGSMQSISMFQVVRVVGFVLLFKLFALGD